MKKNVYSLVLSEDVVSAVDKLAYKNNKNRSAMINEILAEYVSYTTPEQELCHIFKKVEDIILADHLFQLVFQPSASIISLKSALSFKYNPSIKYSVELYKGSAPTSGEFKVSARTQNRQLILYMIEFYKVWNLIEQAYDNCNEYLIEDGKLFRKFTLQIRQKGASVTNEQIGAAIVDYINIFDRCLKLFFRNLHNTQQAIYEIEQIYNNYQTNCTILL